MSKRQRTVGFQRIIGFITGLLGGIFGGLVGVGGGAIMIPLMTALAGLTQHKAHGTSLVAIVFTGAIGAVAYSLHGAVDWKIALMLAVSAILTARLGALYAHSLSEKKLRRGFGVFLMFVSTMLLVKGYLLHAAFALAFWPKMATLLLTGISAGFISGMMGVGGGGIMVPPMVILAGMSQHLAQGTSLLAMVPIGMSGALTHYRLGNVDTRVAGGLIIGAIVGGYLGGTVANMLPELYLRIIFAVIGIWMGTRYVRA
jgi:uncharacterized membrane protein YfcA